MIKLLGVSILTGIPFGVLAQEATGGTNLPTWLQWSVLGAVIAGIVTKQLVPGWAYSDVKAELVAAKAENSRLVQQVLDGQKEVLPALNASTIAITTQSQAIERLATKIGGTANGPVQ